MAILSIFRKALFLATDVALWLAICGLVLMVLGQVTEIAMRYLFAAPTTWISDTVSYLLLMSIFLAVPSVTRDRGHVAVDVVLNTLSPKAGSRVGLCLALGAALACFAIGIFAVEEVVKQIDRGVSTVAAFSIPRWPLTAVISMGFFLSAGHFLLQAISHETVQEGGGL